MVDLKEIELFPDVETRKKWKAEFILAIKNKNLAEVEKLIDSSNKFYHEEFIHHAYIDDNFRFCFDSDVIAKILKKSNDNTLEVIKFIWSLEDLEKLPEDFIYNAETIKYFMKPMVIPMLCPFVVTGVYVFELLGKVQFKVKNGGYYTDFEIYQKLYHKIFGFGKKGEYSVYKSLEKNLHLDLTAYERGQNGELWKFCEIIQYVDSIFWNFENNEYESKPLQCRCNEEENDEENSNYKNIFKLLLHIIEHLKDYVAFGNEIFLHNKNPNINKIIFFKSILFQHLSDEEQNRINELVTLLRQISLRSTAVYFREIIFEISEMKLLEKYPECCPDYVDPTYRDFFEKLSQFVYDKSKDQYSFDKCLVDIKNIEKLIKNFTQAKVNIKKFTDDIQKNQDTGEFKNK